MPTLYQRVLGDHFASLAPPLQRFHSSPGRATGHGKFKVIRPPGLLGALPGLPMAGDDVPMRLVVTPVGRGELWERTLGTVPVVTHQWCRDGLLMERSGPITFGFRLEVVDGGLVFHCERVWAVGVPLPLWFAPSATALVVPSDAGWHVDVCLGLPVVGSFLGYQGEAIPD
jgi:hypothetical protein